MLSGKKAVVAAVTNRFSLGWGIAQALHTSGAQVLITYQGERVERADKQLAATLDGGLTAPLDVEHEDQMDALFDVIRRELGGLDVLVHAMAYAPGEAPRGSAARD